MSALKTIDFALSDSSRIKSILSYQNKLCIQNIHADSASAQFSLVDLESYEIVQEITVEVSGIVPKLFTEDILVVVSYSNESNPDVTDIYGVDWNSGQIMWERPMTKILAANHTSIKIPHRNFQGRYQYVNISDGTELDGLIENDPHADEINYPSGYPESSVYFEWFTKYLKAHGKTPVNHCEYLRLPKQTILSYYIKDGDTLSNELIVIDVQGEILDEFLLESGLKGIGKDTFFIFNDQLIFITNQKTLNFYAL